MEVGYLHFYLMSWYRVDLPIVNCGWVSGLPFKMTLIYSYSVTRAQCSELIAAEFMVIFPKTKID